MTVFSYEIVESLVPVDEVLWNELFCGHPDSYALVRLMDESGLDGFKFFSLLVRDANAAGEIIAILPVFETHYSLACTLDEPVKSKLLSLERIAPGILKPKVLGVGFVEGEWGQFGLNEKIDPAIREEALSGALRYLDTFATKRGAQIVSFKDFTDSTRRALPEEVNGKFAEAVSLPFCQINTEFDSVEAYFQSLPRKVRQDLRRKMRQSAELKIEYTRNADAWMDRIYQLYVEQSQRSELSFGIHNRMYFSEICRRVPGAQYVLFFDGDELIGFNLIIETATCLVDKYIGMDPIKGRANNVYFAAFIEKIRYCVEHKLPVCHLGAAAEGVKVRMGAYMLPSYVFFRHRNPLVNLVLKKLVPVLSYKPAVQGDGAAEAGKSDDEDSASAAASASGAASASAAASAAAAAAASGAASGAASAAATAATTAQKPESKSAGTAA